MDNWFVVVDGKPAGPYQFDELKSLGIVPGTFVKTNLMDDYKEAHEIPELRELLGFKKRITLPQYFATLDMRLLAAAIDYFLISASYLLTCLIIVPFADGQSFRIIVLASGIIIIPLAKIIYAIKMEASAKQGTYGKFWLGLKVCDEKGLPIDIQKSIARNLAKLISKATLGVGYVMGFFHKKQQCIHDTIAGTLVVKARLM